MGESTMAGQPAELPAEFEASIGELDFRALVEGAPVISVVLDSCGSVRYVNSAVTRILDYSPAEVQGRSLFEFVHPSSVEVAKREISALLDDRGPMRLSLRWRHQNGSARVLDTLGRNCLAEPGVRGIVLIARNMTDDERFRQALELPEARYRTFFEQATVGILVTDRDGHRVEANPAICNMLGYTREEILATRVGDFLHPEDQVYVPATFERICAGELVAFTRRMRRKDGSYIHVGMSSRILPNGMIETVVRDISERKRLEQTLRESEQRLRAAVRLANVVVYNLDENLRYTSMLNSQIGLAPEEIIGRTPAEALRAEDAERLMAIQRRVLETGTAAHEEISITRGGRVYYFDLALEPIRDEFGAIKGLTGIALNITGRKRAAQAEVARYRLAETVFNNSVGCTVILDRHFNFVRVNEAYARACRRNIEEFAAKNHFDLYPSDVRPIFEEVVRAKRPFQASARPFKFPDQPERGITYWDWSIVPVLDENEDVEYLVFLLNEVTEQVRAERAAATTRRQLRALSKRLIHVQEEERTRLSRELHAEIGQSLTAIKVQLQSLRDLDRRNRKSFDECIRIVAETHDQVRDLSLSLRPPHLDEFGIEEALRWLLHRQSQATGWQVRFLCDPLQGRLDPVIESACYRIAQEALTNVARHAEAKHVEVQLRNTGAELEIAVRDDGIGFEPRKMRARHGKRASLGLVSMKERAALAGGRLQIKRLGKRGTEILAALPLRWRD